MNNKSITIQGILECLCDGLILSVFKNLMRHIEIVGFNEELEEISSFSVQYLYNPYIRGCQDQNLIYLPTRDGLILGLDKFCGKQLLEINTRGSIPVADLQQDDQNIYCLSVVPVSNGRFIKTNSLVMNIYEKETGKKRGQSCSLHGETGRFSVSNGLIHVVIDNMYYRFDPTGRQISKHISLQTDYNPIPLQDAAYVGSSSGALELFDGNKKTKYFVAPNTTAPIRHRNNIYWFTNQGLYKIGDNIVPVASIRNKKFLFAGVLGNRLFAITEDSEVFAYNTINDALNIVVAIRAKRIAPPCVIGSHILIQLDNSIQSLEI